MTSLLVPPLARDARSQALAALSGRISALDLTPLLVCLVERIPAEALPYLAEDFNVTGPLWEYLPDEAARRRAIAGSVAWHRAKGTPWSVETALAWAGFSAWVEDTTAPANRWAEYQLEMGAPVSEAELPKVLELARFAAPKRAHLTRLYGGFDRRMAVASSGSRWDVAVWSAHSGVRIGGVQLSFGGDYDFVAAGLRGTNAPVYLRRVSRASVTPSSGARWGEINTRFGAWMDFCTNRFFWSDPDSRISAFDPGRVSGPILEILEITHASVSSAEASGHVRKGEGGYSLAYSSRTDRLVRARPAWEQEKIYMAGT
uniref:P2-related tail formation protein n=1 Tax=Candidatus Kentrum sp. LPFa TaxID=2126335 RepID=A0A450WSG3_9GAMM|nr:MAG: P2-related tail formation protein [Candidatus Kentron sp. LPFa]